MPQFNLRIDSAFGTLVDEPVDSAMVDRYRNLRAQGLQKDDLVRALWAEELPAPPRRAVLTGQGDDGHPLHIQILKYKEAQPAMGQNKSWWRSMFGLGW